MAFLFFSHLLIAIDHVTPSAKPNCTGAVLSIEGKAPHNSLEARKPFISMFLKSVGYFPQTNSMVPIFLISEFLNGSRDGSLLELPPSEVEVAEMAQAMNSFHKAYGVDKRSPRAELKHGPEIKAGGGRPETIADSRLVDLYGYFRDKSRNVIFDVCGLLYSKTNSTEGAWLQWAQAEVRARRLPLHSVFSDSRMTDLAKRMSVLGEFLNEFTQSKELREYASRYSKAIGAIHAENNEETRAKLRFELSTEIKSEINRIYWKVFHSKTNYKELLGEDTAQLILTKQFGP